MTRTLDPAVVDEATVDAFLRDRVACEQVDPVHGLVNLEQPPVRDQRRVGHVGIADVMRDLAEQRLKASKRFERTEVNGASFGVVAQPQSVSADHAVACPDLLVGHARSEQTQLSTDRGEQ